MPRSSGLPSGIGTSDVKSPEATEPGADAFLEIVQPQLGLEDLLENPLDTRMAYMANKIRDVILFVTKTQNPLVLFREVSQESGIEKKRVISIVIDILSLQRYAGIVIVEEDRITRLKDRNALSVNS